MLLSYIIFNKSVHFFKKLEKWITFFILFGMHNSKQEPKSLRGLGDLILVYFNEKNEYQLAIMNNKMCNTFFLPKFELL